VVLLAAPAATAKETLFVSGSTSFYPLFTSLAKQYIKEKGRIVSFKVFQGGSDVGIADAARSRVNMGMSSRDEKGADPHGLTWSRIARDAICLVTNPKNPIRNLDSRSVRNIYLGKTVTWNKVRGAKVKGTIHLISRTIASGTQDMFEKLFLRYREHVTPKASRKATNGLVQQTVKSDPNAIGYVSLGFVKGLNQASYDGIACNLRNAKSGNYLATRNFWLVTPNVPSGQTGRFIDWAQTSRGARRVISNGYVPLS
jgi:phosphate transport system substrate-binding protein